MAQELHNEFKHLFTPPKTYAIHRTVDNIFLDGKANEESWKQAVWSDEFEDIEGDKKPLPAYSTKIKMLWDEHNLYIYAEIEEPHVWAYYDQADMIVFHENDFEVFIDPDKDTHRYFEFELNARNTLFDLFMAKPYRNGSGADIKWNAKGFASEVFVDGTLNNFGDEDKKWCVEIQIPFNSLSTDGSYIQPENGDFWKINFSRVQWQTEIMDGKYVRKINPETGRNYPENNWVWNPQGIINMHFPERWGLAMFSKVPAGDAVQVQLPDDELLGPYLWNIYYRQTQYKDKNHRYAKSLEQLGISATGEKNGLNFTLKMEPQKNNAFIARLMAENGLTISINQEGLITTN